MEEQNPATTRDFELRTTNDTTYLACPAFEAEGFVAAFSTRAGSLEGEAFDATAARLLGAIGYSDIQLAHCKQIHSSIVRTLKSPEDIAGTPEECDALTVSAPGVLLGIKTADCVPILIADARTGAVGAIHAGWRGTVARIVERAFAAMVGAWGTRRSDVLVAIGPAVCGACYEVSRDVLDRFKGEFPYAKRFVSNERGDKGHIDLKLACSIQLELCGVEPEQMFMTDYCTMCSNDLFFSFRKEGARAGRVLSVIGRA